MRNTVCLLAVALLLTFVGTSSAHILIVGFTDETNDRFTNSPDFVGAQFDFSGVGRGTRWGTLISPNVVITANHAVGSATVPYQFYPGNDQSATPIERTEISRRRLGNSDLILVALDEPVTSEIAHYSFATEVLSAPPFDSETNTSIFAAGSLQGDEAFIVGLSETSRSPNNSVLDQAVGRNRVTGYIQQIPFLGGRTDAILFANDAEGSSDFVPFETLVQGGDSGAPNFIEQNGELMFIGVNSFVSETDFSGITYVGNYAEEITAFIAMNAVTMELNVGEPQRSAVESITIGFDRDVVLEDGAISVVQRSTATEATFEPVEINVSQQLADGLPVVTVQFDSHVRNSRNALVDGNYQVTLAADRTTLGGAPLLADVVFGDVETDRFHSYFGDNDGNRNVNILEVLAFRQTFGAVEGAANYNPALDFDANGLVNIIDLLPFRNRFNTTLPFTFGSSVKSFQKSAATLKLEQPALTTKPVLTATPALTPVPALTITNKLRIPTPPVAKETGLHIFSIQSLEK